MRGVVSPDKGRVQYRGGGITRQVDAPLQMHDDMHVFYQSGRDLLYARGTQRRGYPWDAYKGNPDNTNTTQRTLSVSNKDLMFVVL